MLYWIDIKYACFGIITDNNGKVIDSAPIAKWTIGKKIGSVKNYYILNGAKIIEIKEG